MGKLSAKYEVDALRNAQMKAVWKKELFLWNMHGVSDLKFQNTDLRAENSTLLNNFCSSTLSIFSFSGLISPKLHLW